jgi:HEAT repeat protein
VPALIQATRDSDRFVRWAAVRSLQQVDAGTQTASVQAIADRLYDSDYEVRIVALDALRDLGSKSAPAVPALAKVLGDRDPDLQLAALKTLENVGPTAKGALPAIIAALKNADVRIRREAPVLLGSFGRDAATAIPALQAALKDSDPEVRVAAARALLAILGGSKSVGRGTDLKSATQPAPGVSQKVR